MDIDNIEPLAWPKLNVPSWTMLLGPLILWQAFTATVLHYHLAFDLRG